MLKIKVTETKGRSTIKSGSFSSIKEALKYFIKAKKSKGKTVLTIQSK